MQIKMEKIKMESTDVSPARYSLISNGNFTDSSSEIVLTVADETFASSIISGKPKKVNDIVLLSSLSPTETDDQHSELNSSIYQTLETTENRINPESQIRIKEQEKVCSTPLYLGMEFNLSQELFSNNTISEEIDNKSVVVQTNNKNPECDENNSKQNLILEVGSDERENHRNVQIEAGSDGKKKSEIEDCQIKIRLELTRSKDIEKEVDKELAGGDCKSQITKCRNNIVESNSRDGGLEQFKNNQFQTVSKTKNKLKHTKDSVSKEFQNGSKEKEFNDMEEKGSSAGELMQLEEGPLPVISKSNKDDDLGMTKDGVCNETDESQNNSKEQSSVLIKLRNKLSGGSAIEPSKDEIPQTVKSKYEKKLENMKEVVREHTDKCQEKFEKQLTQLKEMENKGSEMDPSEDELSQTVIPNSEKEQNGTKVNDNRQTDKCQDKPKEQMTKFKGVRYICSSDGNIASSNGVLAQTVNSKSRNKLGMTKDDGNKQTVECQDKPEEQLTEFKDAGKEISGDGDMTSKDALSSSAKSKPDKVLKKKKDDVRKGIDKCRNKSEKQLTQSKVVGRKGFRDNKIEPSDELPQTLESKSEKNSLEKDISNEQIDKCQDKPKKLLTEFKDIRKEISGDDMTSSNNVLSQTVKLNRKTKDYVREETDLCQNKFAKQLTELKDIEKEGFGEREINPSEDELPQSVKANSEKKLYMTKDVDNKQTHKCQEKPKEQIKESHDLRKKCSEVGDMKQSTVFECMNKSNSNNDKNKLSKDKLVNSSKITKICIQDINEAFQKDEVENLNVYSLIKPCKVVVERYVISDYHQKTHLLIHASSKDASNDCTSDRHKETSKKVKQKNCNKVKGTKMDISEGNIKGFSSKSKGVSAADKKFDELEMNHKTVSYRKKSMDCKNISKLMEEKIESSKKFKRTDECQIKSENQSKELEDMGEKAFKSSEINLSECELAQTVKSNSVKRPDATKDDNKQTGKCQDKPKKQLIESEDLRRKCVGDDDLTSSKDELQQTVKSKSGRKKHKTKDNVREETDKSEIQFAQIKDVKRKDSKDSEIEASDDDLSQIVKSKSKKRGIAKDDSIEQADKSRNKSEKQLSEFKDVGKEISGSDITSTNDELQQSVKSKSGKKKYKTKGDVREETDTCQDKSEKQLALLKVVEVKSSEGSEMEACDGELAQIVKSKSEKKLVITKNDNNDKTVECHDKPKEQLTIFNDPRKEISGDDITSSKEELQQRGKSQSCRKKHKTKGDGRKETYKCQDKSEKQLAQLKDVERKESEDSDMEASADELLQTVTSKSEKKLDIANDDSIEQTNKCQDNPKKQLVQLKYMERKGSENSEMETSDGELSQIVKSKSEKKLNIIKDDSNEQTVECHDKPKKQLAEFNDVGKEISGDGDLTSSKDKLQQTVKSKSGWKKQKAKTDFREETEKCLGKSEKHLALLEIVEAKSSEDSEMEACDDELARIVKSKSGKILIITKNDKEQTIECHDKSKEQLTEFNDLGKEISGDEITTCKDELQQTVKSKSGGKKHTTKGNVREETDKCQDKSEMQSVQLKDVEGKDSEDNDMEASADELPQSEESKSEKKLDIAKDDSIEQTDKCQDKPKKQSTEIKDQASAVFRILKQRQMSKNKKTTNKKVKLKVYNKVKGTKIGISKGNIEGFVSECKGSSKADKKLNESEINCKAFSKKQKCKNYEKVSMLKKENIEILVKSEILFKLRPCKVILERLQSHFIEKALISDINTVIKLQSSEPNKMDQADKKFHSQENEKQVSNTSTFQLLTLKENEQQMSSQCKTGNSKDESKSSVMNIKNAKDIDCNHSKKYSANKNKKRKIFNTKEIKNRCEVDSSKIQLRDDKKEKQQYSADEMEHYRDESKSSAIKIQSANYTNCNQCGKDNGDENKITKLFNIKENEERLEVEASKGRSTDMKIKSTKDIDFNFKLDCGSKSKKEELKAEASTIQSREAKEKGQLVSPVEREQYKDKSKSVIEIKSGKNFYCNQSKEEKHRAEACDIQPQDSKENMKSSCQKEHSKYKSKSSSMKIKSTNNIHSNQSKKENVLKEDAGSSEIYVQDSKKKKQQSSDVKEHSKFNSKSCGITIKNAKDIECNQSKKDNINNSKRRKISDIKEKQEGEASEIQSQDSKENTQKSFSEEVEHCNQSRNKKSNELKKRKISNIDYTEKSECKKIKKSHMKEIDSGNASDLKGSSVEKLEGSEESEAHGTETGEQVEKGTASNVTEMCGKRENNTESELFNKKHKKNNEVSKSKKDCPKMFETILIIDSNDNLLLKVTEECVLILHEKGLLTETLGNGSNYLLHSKPCKVILQKEDISCYSEKLNLSHRNDATHLSNSISSKKKSSICSEFASLNSYEDKEHKKLKKLGELIESKLKNNPIVKHLICESCNKTFPTHNLWLKHNIKHHNRCVYKCGMCDTKSFKWRNDFTSHIKKFHPEIERTPFVCENSKCKEMFSTLKELRDHNRCHLKFVCRFCKKCFAKKYPMRLHVLKHHLP